MEENLYMPWKGFPLGNFIRLKMIWVTGTECKMTKDFLGIFWRVYTGKKHMKKPLNPN